MKRKAVFFTLLVLPALVFASGGGQQQAFGGGAGGGYLRFAWWGNTTRDERTVKVSQLFIEKNPGVMVETEPTAWDGYWAKLNTQAAAGSLPDVMQQDYMYIAQYNNRNQLVDMNAYVQSGLIDLSKWADSAVAAGRLDGKLVALSLGTNAWGIGVDPEVLKQAEITIDDTTWTWQDFEQYALTIYQKTGVQTMPPNEFHQLFEHTVRQYGKPYFAKDSKSLGWTDSPAIIKDFIDVFLRLKAAGALFNPEEGFLLNLAIEEEPISRGKTWNAYYWSNQHIGHLNAAKRPLDYLICPSVNGNKAPFGTYLKPSQFISMLASSRNKDLAAKFVNFILNDLEANRILLAERGIPVPTSVREDLGPRVDPNMKYLFDYITRVTPFTSPIDPPDPAVSGEVRDVIRPLLLQALTGQLSSDAAVAQMIQAANTVLTR
ncbi:MAG: ABC transporter substrate-binding protein [Treponema sp.]|nr:ABC transporter substrate-binding protein [Treponema sp.]